jgi:hypothetical protein
LEPFQEQATKIIVELEEEKTMMTQVHAKSTKSLKEHITTQMVEELIEKGVQAKAKWEELEGKFHDLEKVMKGANTT